MSFASTETLSSHAFGDGAPRPRVEIGPATLIGILASLTMMVTFLLWAHFTPINGAVVTPGQAMVPGKPSVVQSLDGGMVAQILVANGDKVVAGQILLQLDPKLIKVKLNAAMNRLAAGLALRARLEAEQAGLKAPDFALPDLPFTAPDISRDAAGQMQIFSARAEISTGRRAQLAEQESQIGNQIKGVEARISARTEQLSLIEHQLANVQTLFDKGMVRESDLLELQRKKAGLLGEIAGDEAERARLENALRDAQIATDQADRAFLEQVATDLRTTVTQIEEVIFEIVTLQDQMARLDIRAPVAGMVHELQVTTLGAVVPPGATIMQIVPQGAGIEFELKLPAKDLERVHVGQAAQLVLPTLDPRSTPRLAARVTTVSPAAVTDPQTMVPFYRVTLAVESSELARLGGIEILPGMPVDAYLQTGERSALSYLLAPMAHQLMQAFREE